MCSQKRRHSAKSLGEFGCRAPLQSLCTAQLSREFSTPFPVTPGTAAWILGSLSQRQGGERLRSRAGKGSQSREKEPGQDPAGASYLSPLPAEMHQHRRSLVDLAAIEHPAASQHHGHPLCHGPPGAEGSPESRSRCELCWPPAALYSASPPQEQVGPRGLG